MQDREHVVLPRRPDQSSRQLLARLSIAKVMEFTSQSLRSVGTAAVCVAAMMLSIAIMRDVTVTQHCSCTVQIWTTILGSCKNPHHSMVTCKTFTSQATWHRTLLWIVCTVCNTAVLPAIRSGVVVWSDDAPKGAALLFLRGAPTVIKDLVQPESVPERFNEVSPSCCSISAYCCLLLLHQSCIPKSCSML